MESLKYFLAVWLVFLGGAFVSADERVPQKYELRLIYIFEQKEPEYIFTIGDSGFKTVDSLKNFLGSLPAGSEVKWAPGCTRFGKEPLLSSEKDMDEFRSFLKKKGITFVLVPAG